jgi:16S rRNA (guanine(966)-N(2))-methyltransferase RsmD
LKSIPGEATRPTPDRLRETLFDILQTRIEGGTFVDAYAGTGAVGIEALSRGARHAYFLERDRTALAAMRENLMSLGAGARATIVPGPVVKSLTLHRGDIVFLDPPYALEKEYASAMEVLGGEAPLPDGRGSDRRESLWEPRPPGSDASSPRLVIVQHSVRMDLAEAYGALRRTRVVQQGDNALSFYE